MGALRSGSGRVVLRTRVCSHPRAPPQHGIQTLSSPGAKVFPVQSHPSEPSSNLGGAGPELPQDGRGGMPRQRLPHSTHLGGNVSVARTCMAGRRTGKEAPAMQHCPPPSFAPLGSGGLALSSRTGRRPRKPRAGACAGPLFSPQLSGFCFLRHQGYLFLTYDQKTQKDSTDLFVLYQIKMVPRLYRNEVMYTPKCLVRCEHWMKCTSSHSQPQL